MTLMLERLSHLGVQTFAINPRSLDRKTCWSDIRNVTSWSERHGCSGVLIFTGGDAPLDPWVVAQHVLGSTERLTPLIALNPIYSHPYTAAKMIASYAVLFERQVFINLVAGATVSYQRSLGDVSDHDRRYDRLREYVKIVDALLSDRRPLTFTGDFYSVSQLKLPTLPPAELLPRYLLSGHSEAASRLRDDVGAVGMQMLPASLDEGVDATRTGLHFGIVTRPTAAEAWDVARRRFPDDPERREIMDAVAGNSDSVWRARMKMVEASAGGKEGFWLQPFANFYADCPYFVGSYEEVSALVTRLVGRGVRWLIFDIPPSEQEFEHVAAALR